MLSFTVQCSAADVDLTFFFTADTHYGLRRSVDNEQRNKDTIDLMNNLPGTPYPAAIGGVVGTPSGVLVAGDLTDAGNGFDWAGIHFEPFLSLDGFVDDYGLNGESRLNYPVFEGYGNHDVSDGLTIVPDGIAERNLLRDQPINISSNGYHYSWDWQGIHFVNLNAFPGEERDSFGSLSFLKDDLAARVGDSGRPVILYHHYGFDSFSTQDRWWTAAERQAYADAIDGYDVLGIFHGHLHTLLQYQWEGYDVFDGSPAHGGNFLVVHITNDTFSVAARSGNSWRYAFQKSIAIPEVRGQRLCGAVVVSFGIFMSFARLRAANAGLSPCAVVCRRRT